MGLWGCAAIRWPPGPGTEQIQGLDSQPWVGHGKAGPHCASLGSVRTTHIEIRGVGGDCGCAGPHPHNPTESGSLGLCLPCSIHPQPWLKHKQEAKLGVSSGAGHPQDPAYQWKNVWCGIFHDPQKRREAVAALLAPGSRAAANWLPVLFLLQA